LMISLTFKGYRCYEATALHEKGFFVKAEKVIKKWVGPTFGEGGKMESWVYMDEGSDEQLRITFDQK
jgi:NAD dependent epimerase/dehydratase family enzyme